jgi:hypothetical protein
MQNYLTKDDIQEVIDQSRIQFHVFPDTTLTVCAITLPNGYTVTGESATIAAENFDEEIGKSMAAEDAVRKIWQLEGYLMRQMLMLAEDPETMAKVTRLQEMDKPVIQLVK